MSLAGCTCHAGFGSCVVFSVVVVCTSSIGIGIRLATHTALAMAFLLLTTGAFSFTVILATRAFFLLATRRQRLLTIRFSVVLLIVTIEQFRLVFLTLLLFHIGVLKRRSQ